MDPVVPESDPSTLAHPRDPGGGSGLRFANRLIRPALVNLGRGIAWLVLVLGGLGLLLPLSLLIVVGQSRSGRLVGGLSLAMLWAMLSCVVMVGSSPGATVRRIAGISLAGSAAGAALLAITIAAGLSGSRPVGRAEGLTSRHVDQTRAAPHGQIWDAILPEGDLVQLGAAIVTRVVPWMSRAEGGLIRARLREIYREFNRSSQSLGLGSVTDLAVLELLGLGARTAGGHFFAYLPQRTGEGRLGAVVFLHGNGGNFKIFPWVFREFCERNRLAIICPTYGFGFWGAGGVEAVRMVLDDAVRTYDLDPKRLFLAGLSDGGVGVTRAAAGLPGRFRGLVYFSATMRPNDLQGERFRIAASGLPILVIQGGRDWSVTPRSVEAGVQIMRGWGAEVTFKVFAEEGHFALFNKLEEILKILEQWLTERERHESGADIPTRDPDGESANREPSSASGGPARIPASKPDSGAGMRDGR